MVTTKDEELSLFFELRRHEKEMEKSSLLVDSPVGIDASSGKLFSIRFCLFGASLLLHFFVADELELHFGSAIWCRN